MTTDRYDSTAISVIIAPLNCVSSRGHVILIRVVLSDRDV